MIVLKITVPALCFDTILDMRAATWHTIIRIPSIMQVFDFSGLFQLVTPMIPATKLTIAEMIDIAAAT